jgi:hypothetical protein
MSALIPDTVLIVELWLRESLYDDRPVTEKGLMNFPDDAMTGVRRKPVVVLSSWFEVACTCDIEVNRMYRLSRCLNGRKA